MKYLPLSLLLGVSGLLFNAFSTYLVVRTQPVEMTPSLAGINCPKDKDKPCIDDEIRLVSIKRKPLFSESQAR